MTREEAIKIIDCYDIGFYDLSGEKIPAEKLVDAFDMAIEALEQKRWIPCSERLPENAKHKGAFCPRYYVMTEFGLTEGWYNPDVGCWYVLLWFMDARFETWNINLERGDVPKLVKNVPVVAWMPLPEPYKGGEW